MKRVLYLVICFHPRKEEDLEIIELFDNGIEKGIFTVRDGSPIWVFHHLENHLLHVQLYRVIYLHWLIGK